MVIEKGTSPLPAFEGTQLSFCQVPASNVQNITTVSIEFVKKVYSNTSSPIIQTNYQTCQHNFFFFLVGREGVKKVGMLMNQISLPWNFPYKAEMCTKNLRLK